MVNEEASDAAAVTEGYQPIYSATSVESLWELARKEYPDDQPAHFMQLIAYCAAGYGLLHLLLHSMFVCCNKRYVGLSREKQGAYRTNIEAMILAGICILTSVSAMFFICGDGKTPLNDDECMDTPRYLHIWALVNTCGYFIADTFNIAVLIRTFTTYDKQMLWHHVIACLTFMSTLAFMNFTVVIGVLLLFVEVSTPYIGIRWILYTHR